MPGEGRQLIMTYPDVRAVVVKGSAGRKRGERESEGQKMPRGRAEQSLSPATASGKLGLTGICPQVILEQFLSKISFQAYNEDVKKTR